jgi:single-strand DNA-binding protein
MASLNKVMLIGYLGKDPIYGQSKNGDAYLSFSLATKNYNGETSWHRVSCFKKQADTLRPYLQKGHLVYVEGNLSYGSYRDQDGYERKTTDILANTVQMLNRPQGSAQIDDPAAYQNQETQTQPQPQAQAQAQPQAQPQTQPLIQPQAEPVYEDDLPF